MSRLKSNELSKTRFLDEENSIKVTLISHPDAEMSKKMIINTCYGYDKPAIYDELNEEQRAKAINTVVSEGTLPKSLEMLGKFVFLIENISLTVTHCLVRHRFFTILQQSTAVSDQRDVNFVMPRSFARDDEFYNEVKSWYLEGKKLFCKAVDEHGISVQNARLLIPKNNCNHMFIGADVLALKHAYGQRVDTQEEPIQNNIIFKEIKRLVLEKFPYLEKVFVSHCETGHCLHCKPGKHSNVVFKRNYLHSKRLMPGYLLANPDNTLHDKTRDEMNEGPVIEDYGVQTV